MTHKSPKTTNYYENWKTTKGSRPNSNDFQNAKYDTVYDK